MTYIKKSINARQAVITDNQTGIVVRIEKEDMQAMQAFQADDAYKMRLISGLNIIVPYALGLEIAEAFNMDV